MSKKELTLKEVFDTMKKLEKKGYKPYLKGKKGKVKLEFE